VATRLARVYRVTPALVPDVLPSSTDYLCRRSQRRGTIIGSYQHSDGFSGDTHYALAGRWVARSFQTGPSGYGGGTDAVVSLSDFVSFSRGQTEDEGQAVGAPTCYRNEQFPCSLARVTDLVVTAGGVAALITKYSFQTRSGAAPSRPRYVVRRLDAAGNKKVLDGSGVVSPGSLRLVGHQLMWRRRHHIRTSSL